MACACCSIPNGCCPSNNTPPHLHATIAGDGTCNGTYLLTFNAGTNFWDSGATTIGICPTGIKPALAVGCTGSGPFIWQVQVDGSFIAGGTTLNSCTPLDVTVPAGSITELNGGCGCANPGTTSLHITL